MAGNMRDMKDKAQHTPTPWREADTSRLGLGAKAVCPHCVTNRNMIAKAEGR